MDTNTCLEASCSKPPKGGRGLCPAHYRKAKLRGDFGGEMCKIAECTSFGTAGRGLCAKHYTAAKRRGEFGATCKFEGCPNGAVSSGLCNSHHSQVLRGKALTPIKVTGEWQKWETNTKGYVFRRRTDPATKIRTNQWQHRYVIEEFLGRELEPHEEVHHVNGVRDDNRLENLEVWSTSQPKGQRLEDKTRWALDWLKKYDPEKLK